MIWDPHWMTKTISGVPGSANETLFEAARAGEGRCVLGDDRLYAASEDGEVYVVAAGPGLTETARNDIQRESSWEHRRSPAG